MNYMLSIKIPKQKDKTSEKMYDAQGKEVVFKCPECGIPMERGKEKFDKDNFGVAKLTCKKCGKISYDFMIPNESFFGPNQAE